MTKRFYRYLNRKRCRWCDNPLTLAEKAFWEDTCTKCHNAGQQAIMNVLRLNGLTPQK